jgi:hypothetical protein
MPGQIFWETTISSERNPTFSTEYNHIESVLTELAHSWERLAQLRPQSMAYAREGLAWDAKAQDTTQALRKTVTSGKRFIEDGDGQPIQSNQPRE